MRNSAASPVIALHGGALGDLVLSLQLLLATPFVRRARRLKLFSGSDPGDLRACAPSIERQSIEGLGVHWLFAELDSGSPPEILAGRLRGASVFNFLDAADSRVHRRLVELGAARVCSVDPRPLSGTPVHITTQWRRQLESQLGPLAACTYERRGGAALRVPPELRERGRATLARLCGAEDCIVVHPGSGGREKCWALPRFLEVGESLRSRGMLAAFVLGPAELERWPQQDVAAIRSRFPLALPQSGDELRDILAGARAYVGNDSGPTHLAALLGVPSVALFGPTEPSVWRPLGPRVAIIRGNPQRDAFGWDVATEDVLRAVRELLA